MLIEATVRHSTRTWETGPAQGRRNATVSQRVPGHPNPLSWAGEVVHLSACAGIARICALACLHLGERYPVFQKGEASMQHSVLKLLSPRKGHFLLESGYHGDRWLGLQSLCLRPRPVQALAVQLADRLAKLEIEVVCGPLVEGAFVGLMVASRLDIQFTYSERFSQPARNGLFPAGYRVPAQLREGLQGKRVAIVNDVISAGSAVRGTFADLQECGANVIAIGALLALGASASEFATRVNVVLTCLESLPNNLWTPSACPLCARSVPLEDVEGFAATLLANPEA
jgi:orotate phosphoribosyltransferase